MIASLALPLISGRFTSSRMSFVFKAPRLTAPPSQWTACRSFNIMQSSTAGQRCSLTTSAAAATSVTASSAEQPSFKLILYSKPDCPLCDKLKDKLEAIMDRAAFTPSILSGVELEVRNIAGNPAWEAAYAMEVPVLAAAAPDGSGERQLQRPSPRLTNDMLEKHLAKCLNPAATA